MRWVGCLLLVGCYSPGRIGACEIACTGEQECPSGLTCSNNACAPIGSTCNGPVNDGGPDVMGDMTSDMMSTVCINGKLFITNPSAVPHSGRSYSSNSSGIVLFENGGIEETTLASSSSTGVTIQNLPNGQPSNPQMSWVVSGDPQAFFVLTDGNTHTLMKMTRVSAGLWGNPTEVITTPAIGATFRPGQPTGNNPRRMMASTASGLLEGIEQPDKSWSFTPVTMTTVVMPRDPNLSIDGLGLVLAGIDGGGMVRGFFTTRPGLDAPFEPPMTLPDNNGVSGNEQTPAFSPDCQTIFLSFDTTIMKFE